MDSIERKQRTYRYTESYRGKDRVLLGRKRDYISSLGHTGKRKGHYEHMGTPYAVRPKNREDQHREDQIQITVWKDGESQKRDMGQHQEDGTLGSWFKVTFLCERHQIRFFVQDASTACALKDVTYKICDDDSYKIPIFVNPSEVPYSVQNRLTQVQMEQLKLALKKRYDVSRHALDLQNLYFDPDLLDQKIYMVLSRRSCMTAALQIIQEDFPELLSLNLSCNRLFRLDSLFDVGEKAPQVKTLNLSENKLNTVWELEKVKGLKLEELWLEGNPLCSTFPDHSAYVRYYLIYDYGNRQNLLSVYDEQACFSLTILSGMCKYLKNEVDMKNPKEFRKCVMRRPGRVKKLGV
ncbi:hypothetical protein ACRRTK_002089 [Alexandromys fortis]